MFYRVELIDKSIDDSFAEIIPYQHNGGVVYTIVSDNQIMQSHLDRILQRDAYIIAPSKNTATEFTDSVVHLLPHTVEYLQCLPEILSLRGYFAEYKSDVHKSVDYAYVMKSSGNGTYVNEAGETIVTTVPAGYVAVHTDGRTVPAGRYLNANIDKEGAEWSLVENPYEKQSEAERAQAKVMMDARLEDYHPGADAELYAEREEGDYYKAKRKLSKSKLRTTLIEYFKNKMAADEAPEEQVEPAQPQVIPPRAAANTIVYSPDAGVVMPSEEFPPDNWEQFSWYQFNRRDYSREERSVLMSIEPNPQYLDVTQGSKEARKDMDLSGGVRLRPSTAGSERMVFNSPAKKEFSYKNFVGAYQQTEVSKAMQNVRRLKGMTQTRDQFGGFQLSPELETMEVPNLRGENAVFRFDLRNYQKATVAQLVDPNQYEAYGGPEGYYGRFINSFVGSGKTAMVCAADAVMRNEGRFENGKQVTIVTAPSANTYVWRDEIAKFRGEGAVVIDGNRESRIQQWESLIKQAQAGEMPNFVVVGSSKFRFDRVEEAEEGEDQHELALDAQYMKLLSTGGISARGTETRGNHIGAFVLDESGQYVNPDSARFRAVQDITESVYYGDGVVWTLNGTLSGNSATDTISELSFVNMHVKDNYRDIVNAFTIEDRDTVGRGSGRRRWSWNTTTNRQYFSHLVGDQISILRGQAVAGDKYGFDETEDEIYEIGEEWGEVYNEAHRKLRVGYEEGLGGRALALFGMMVGSAYGATAPARLFEYDIGADKLLSDVKNRLRKRMTAEEKAEDYRQFDTLELQLKQFLSATTSDEGNLGRYPVKGMLVEERDRLYESIVSERFRNAIDEVVRGWDNPFIEGLMSDIEEDLKFNTVAGKPRKIGVAGWSRRVMETLHSRLADKYPADKVLVNIVTGSTGAQGVAEIQKMHNEEKERSVITMVTSAGLYGLSLASDRSFRMPTWNSAKGAQFDGRFHRHPEQANMNTKVVPSGAPQVMRQLENIKSAREMETTKDFLNINMDGDEIELTSGQVGPLLERLEQFPPIIRKRRRR